MFRIGTLSFFLHNYIVPLIVYIAAAVVLHRLSETNRMDPKSIVLIEGIMIFYEQVINIPHVFLIGIPPLAL